MPSATGKPSLQEMAAQHGRDVQARVIADIERWKKLGLMPADGAPAAPGPAKAEAEEVAEEARRVALAINPSRRGVLPENWKR